MRNIIIVVIAVVVAFSALAGATEAPWQYDKATLKAMTVTDLEAKGDILRAQKDYQSASLLFQEAIKRQRKNPILYNKLGLVQLQLKEYDQAASAFRKAIKLDPKYADALNNLGSTCYVRKDLDGSARYYRKALALDETRAVFHSNLGTTWMAQNKFNLALKEYARALELDPEVLMRSSATGIAAQISTPEQRASRYFLLARVFAIRGDVDTAVEYLKKAKEEGYRGMDSVYKQQEFAKLWSDARLAQIVPAPQGK